MRRDARRFTGCASLGTRLRLPGISLVNLRPLPSTSFGQQLEITLRVLVANAVPLEEDGIMARAMWK